MSGHIFPEYWISCAGCDDCKPLAERDVYRAHNTAKALGWRTDTNADWHCPRCVGTGKSEGDGG